MSNDALKKALDDLGQTIQKRDTAKVYQLALWSDQQRGVPNEFARSALFPAISPNKARYVDRATVFSQRGFIVTFTGKQLTQSDLDVFEGIMHIARGTHEGNSIRFTAHHLLKLIGRATGKSQYEWLLTVLYRLTGSVVGIERDNKRVFWGSLLPKGAADLEDGKFIVEINRDLIKLFSNGFTLIQSNQRRALGKKPLAQALHLWINSHEGAIYPVTVQWLHDLTGSQTKELYAFRQNLRAALAALEKVRVIAPGWHIDDADKVHITKLT